METEVWKPIEGYENYEVSSLGRVRSLCNDKTRKEKVLRQHNNGHGYLIVNLCKNGKMKSYKVHRLVAQTFLPNPENLPIINHKNEIKTDNSVENLEFCTHKYNIHYSKNWEKSSEVTRKPVIQFTKDGQFVAEYESAKEAERKTGIHQGNISSCCLGRKHHKSAGNYKWKYKDE